MANKVLNIMNKDRDIIDLECLRSCEICYNE